MIQLRGISKIFGSFKALDNVTFDIHNNAITALIGENGAGKSTLMKILAGLEKADQGQMFLNDESYLPQSAEQAFKKGFGLVHQHFQLADALTGWDHLKLATRHAKQSINQLKHLSSEKQKLFGWSIPLDLAVKDLSVGQQQRLEILRVLILEPKVIIFDEPTAVLSPDEIEAFLSFLQQLKHAGHTLILISHKLKEIEKIADDVVVLKTGQVVFKSQMKATSVDQLAEKMIGQKTLKINFTDRLIDSKSEALKITVLDKNLDVFNNEILGVIGVDGNGQDTLITEFIQQAMAQKINYGDISEDRYRYGIYPDLSVSENLLVRHRKHFYQYSFLNQKKLKTAVQSLIAEWDVRPGLSDQKMAELSGGNQQKFVVGRELWGKPDWLLAAHPTRGVDLGAQKLIHENIINLARTGPAFVLLVSSDLDEVLNLADRYIILYKKQIFGPFNKNQLSLQEISCYMNGVNQ